MNFTEFLNRSIIQTENYNLTVSQILAILVILLTTYLALYLIKKLIGSFFKRRKLDVGRQYALFQLIRYFVWVLVLVITLQILSIKITFLLAGSAALLVGLGFGLQQIFQDLVSGVFILLEGTIHVDDVIELDGLVGKILSINLRTSKVMTRDGIIIIVPNHKFIADNIINWSHSATATRFKVSVGVAYGSDVEKVKQVLLGCANNHPDVIKQVSDPTRNPFVRFIDFGESALLFELYFWNQNIFYIENTKSDIRFNIDTSFRKNQITIPFPQRDIHMK